MAEVPVGTRPLSEQLGVDIDPELFEIGHRYFGLEARPQLREHTKDARPFLRQTDERYDAIFVDAYRQPYIPFYLTTREFFELARDRLAPGGVVIVNVGAPEGSDELEKVLGGTMATAFGSVMRDPMEPTNTLLVAGEGPLSAARLRAAADRLPAELRAGARGAAERLEARLPGGEVYTDDHAPVEWLVDSSLLEYANE